MSADEPRECPQCGFDQPAGEECLRCGIVFARYRGTGVAMPARLYTPVPKEPEPRVSEEDRRINRGSWLLLLLLLTGAAVWSEVRPGETPELTEAGDEPGEPLASSVEPTADGPSRELRADASPPAGVEDRRMETIDGGWRDESPLAPPPPAPPARGTYTMGYTWLEQLAGFERGMRDAIEQDRIVTLYVYTDWCPYCRELERNVLDDYEVQQCLAYSVKVKINPDTGPAEKAIAKRFGVTGYPRLLFVDPVTGAYQAAPRFLDTSGPLLDACRRKIS
jgi:thiol-disulfide isomerase/thioredoxin